MRYLTVDLPGTGGHYKDSPEDFQVEEIPLYPCSGTGEHLYLWIEKTGLSTHELLNRLGRELQLRERDFGYAGLKDARARTRQMISVPATCAEDVSRLQIPDVKILDATRHGNKLRLGHLAGNRFRIRLTDVGPDAARRAEAILAVLQSKGVPNRFGEQRYGVLGNSAVLGLLLAQGDYTAFCRELLGDPAQIRNPAWQAAATAYRQGDLQTALAQLPRRMRDEQRLLRSLLAGKSPRDAVLGLSRKLLRLFLSASQSLLFDRLLDLRLDNLDRLHDGDIAMKHDNGACFRVESAAAEQQRADAFSISPTAPLFGHKVMLATGLPGQQEQQVLEEFSLTPKSWKLGDGLNMPGERRSLRTPLTEVRILGQEERCLELEFCLPKGAYATNVLREICK